ncbi:MAG: CinA family protein [Anaerolineales bacterium]
MGKPLEVSIGQALRAAALRLALAESCTGGLVGHLITNVPGSSDYLAGGVVAYSDQAKQRLLGVQQSTLKQHGAVSRQTALEMARGARQAFEADIGLAVTGIAGPGGGTAEKPIGLTWVAVSSPWGEHAELHTWRGDREHNKAQSAEAALALLASILEERRG